MTVTSGRIKTGTEIPGGRRGEREPISNAVHSHHQNGFRNKLGKGVRYFHVSLNVQGKVSINKL